MVLGKRDSVGPTSGGGNLLLFLAMKLGVFFSSFSSYFFTNFNSKSCDYEGGRLWS